MNNKYIPGFTWPVPWAFKDAVAECLFEEGDILYDDRRAYCEHGELWGEVAQYLRLSVQVLYPKRSIRPSSDGEDNEQEVRAGGKKLKLDRFMVNWRRRVDLTIFVHEEHRHEIVSTTQGRLFTMLWKGNPSIINPKTREPAAPVGAAELSRAVRNMKDNERLRSLVGNESIFMLVSDQVSDLMVDKLSRVRACVARFYKAIGETIRPGDLCPVLENIVKPAITIQYFRLGAVSLSEFTEQLRPYLYMGIREEKDSRFRVKTHGLFVAHSGQS
jgi:hypothetical protein